LVSLCEREISQGLRKGLGRERDFSDNGANCPIIKQFSFELYASLTLTLALLDNFMLWGVFWGRAISVEF